uniref:KIAA0513 n=1 Tax=Neolamprologus brichardi TaxID=32507 RepID=A0A3Q4HE73_NEOBR
MEGVAVDNLIDFDLPSETKTLNIDGGQHQGHTDIFSPEPASSTGVHQLPEPMAPTKPNSHHQSEEGNNDSDATESADSENDMDPPSHEWELRRSSSSSAHSGEEADAETVERRQFMKTYVEKVFHGKEDFDQEEKARFGELCSGENGKGREWFAKYVSAQRCHSKCVSEATFYRLVQSFAVVLFEECYQQGLALCTQHFELFFSGKSQPSPSELLDRGGAPAGLDSYLNKANTWLSGKKDAAERLLKHTSKTDVKGFFGGLESKLRSSVAPNDGENPGETKPKSPEEKKGEKVYLYTHLKQQPIWEKWCHMTDEEKKDSYKIDENIAFGQLGTFTHNMLAFGLSRKLCNDFLKKQAVIGNLNEGKLTEDHIKLFIDAKRSI